MGARNHTLVRCVATAPPDRDAWFNTLLWIISLFHLLINIGRGVLPPSQNLARQSRQPTSPRLPFIFESTHTSDVHRASLISSEPINRGPGTGANGSTTETASSTPPPPDEQLALQTHPGQAGARDTDSRQPNSNPQNPSVSPKPITRLLLYGADNEAGVFISDMRKFAYACGRYLGSHSQVDDRVVMGDVGFEFGTFFSQTNLRIHDMLIFGETHGPNVTRRELYGKITEHLESLNKTLRRKNMPPQIPTIFSSVPDRNQVLDGYALRPLLLADHDTSNTA
ncbi:hypothetical protein RSOLAG22IIIB_06004 [Rhizoctonia solani]|uniref:Uncharacterized protein n=1 Tax=Rhizoctonia solani TaxID=456999 RepID=A0A0K6GB21_9AGAM|nr:hypothetical protein RSOLAG22IIIB_06004 [Rhizoctonia solani]